MALTAKRAPLRSRALSFLCAAIFVFLFWLPCSLFAQTQRLVIGHSAITPSQAIVYIMKDGGIADKYHLDLMPTFISGSKAVMALVAGDIGFLLTGGTSVVAPAARGAGVVIVAGLVNKVDYGFFVSPDIKAPAELRGGAVAITTFGDTSDFLTRYFLTRWGLRPEKDVTLLQTGAQPERFAALRSGRVKGTILQVPNTLIARRMGFTELLKPGDLNIDYQGTVVASTRSFLTTHTSVAKLFMEALVEGIYFFKTNRSKSLNTIAKFLKMKDSELTEESYGFYSNAVAPLPYPTLEGIQTILDDRKKSDSAIANLKATSLIDIGILKEIEREGLVNSLYGK
jgi:NitT/TauT family transport system substrate-binding protein